MMLTVDPLTHPGWQQLVKDHQTDVFHSTDWLQILHQTYGFDFQALLIENQKHEAIAGLTYCLIEDALGKRIVSLPFSDFLDPLVSKADQWSQLINELLKHDCPVKFRVLHNELALQDSRLTKVNHALWHAVDLQRTQDEMWQSISSSAKRAIKKATKQGIKVKEAQDKAELRSFYDMHLGIRKHKYHLLAQPYAFFEAIWDQFILKGKGKLLLAYLDTKILGGILFLEWQHKLYYKFNASHPDFLQLRPNDLIIWRGICYGQENNFCYLDFGLSDYEQEGLVKFKRKYATEEKAVSFLQYQPVDSNQQVKDLTKLLPKLTHLFTQEHVPDDISEEAGNLLYRLFT